MFAYKGRCTEHARFLTVGEKHDYVVHKGRSGAQRADGLENGGRGSAIVRRAGSGFDTVVVGHKKNRWSAALAAGHSRENILNSSGFLIACANGSRMLDLRLETQDAELRD
jgi:hypothetical protein